MSFKPIMRMHWTQTWMKAHCCCRFHGQTCHPQCHNSQVNEVHSNDIKSLINVDYQLSQKCTWEEHLDSDCGALRLMTIDPISSYLLDTEAQNFQTENLKKATGDLHKDILGTRNPGLGYMAKRAQPALYDADTLFHPTHHPVHIWDSEEVLVHQVVSMKKMNEKPGHVRPANDLKFVDQHNMVAYLERQKNTTTSKIVNSGKQIRVIVDGKAVVISESSVRNDLLFNDEDSIACLTNNEIFENLALMKYEQLSTKPTFQKGSLSPQWKFLIHSILHCISLKSTAWNEFSTNLASAVICLAKG
ncbi:hypothetical protein Tco_1054745 [Tanacetum coccineum]|uniref:Uncharacterized protein n=1 Tax=Tanacetum coccineum TaxID=301880 RepID=A0ABQ5GXQ3_9ASTR